MDEGPDYGKPRDWPQDILDLLEPLGITQYETLDTIKPKLDAAGFKIVAMSEDKGGMLSTYPLYYAAVYGSDPDDDIRGEYWSETDYAEALAWAASAVLRERKIQELYAQHAEDESS